MNLLQKLLKKGKAILAWFLRLSLIKKAVIVGLLLLIGWFGFSNFSKQNTTPQYQTAQAEVGTLVSSVTSSGTITSGSNASITTSATGIVNEVYVQNGDYVEQGQNIATITLDSSSQQKQAAAYASYLSAQNSLNNAKNQMNALQAALFEANQKFVKDKGVSDPDTDDPTYIIENANWLKAEADYNNQKNVIAQEEASFTSAALLYAQTSSVITAPIAGVISNLTITSGLPLISSSDSSSANASAQSIGNITLEGAKLTATINLTEIDVIKVKVGQKVTLTLDVFPDKTFTGKVSSINTNGSVSSGVTTYPTTITFDTTPENVYPNMAVNATIITKVKQDVVIVPTSAVQTVSGESTVRVLKNGKVQIVSVETGISSDTQTEIVSGLTEGQEVVTGTVSTQTGSSQTSPFGNTGFGGATRSFGGGGTGAVRIIQR